MSLQMTAVILKSSAFLLVFDLNSVYPLWSWTDLFIWL